MSGIPPTLPSKYTAKELKELVERLIDLEAANAAKDQAELELIEQLTDLEADNAAQQQEIIRLGNQQPPTVVPMVATKGILFSHLPPLPPAGSTPPAGGGTNVPVQQAQGGAMPPMP